MSRKHSKPEWHEPVKTIGGESDNPIEASVEVGAIALVDGPIDPTPLGTMPRPAADFNPPRSSAGPMPDLQSGLEQSQNSADTVKDFADGIKDKGQDMIQNATQTAQTLTDKAQDTAQAAADKAKEAALKIAEGASTVKTTTLSAGSASKSFVAGAAGSAGAGLWSIIQRNPLQAILFLSSLIWLIRSNNATASQPPVSVTDAAGNAAEKVGSISGHIQVAAGNLGTQVQTQAQQGAGWFSRTLQENPLVIGAMAIVAGAGLGLAVPETSYEHKALGKTRDQLLDKAQGAASDLGHKVQTVAQTAVHEAIETAKEEAKNQGLTSPE